MRPGLLLVCGSRAWTDHARVATELASYSPLEWDLMHGACPTGADALADEVALERGWCPGVTLHRRPADWTLGPRAGPLRNEVMAEELGRAAAEGRRVEAFAFGALAKPDAARPGTTRPTGTGDMVARLRRRGLRVRWVPAPGVEAQELPVSTRTTCAPSTSGAPMRVASARLSYRGPGALCVARDIVDRALAAGKPTPGAAFAPTRALLDLVLPARREANQLLDEAERLPADARHAGLTERALQLEAEAWARYRPLYLAGMLVTSRSPAPPGWDARVARAREIGFVPAPEAWAALPEMAAAATGRLVFTCFCGPRWRHHCHTRTLCEIFARRGAVDEGEVAPGTEQVRLPGV